MQVKWGDIGGDSDDEVGYVPAEDENNGIVLTVGCVPGLKVDAIPLLRSVKVTNSSLKPQCGFSLNKCFIVEVFVIMLIS